MYTHPINSFTDKKGTKDTKIFFVSFVPFVFQNKFGQKFCKLGQDPSDLIQ